MQRGNSKAVGEGFKQIQEGIRKASKRRAVKRKKQHRHKIRAICKQERKQKKRKRKKDLANKSGDRKKE